jgi:hypothetical protein
MSLLGLCSLCEDLKVLFESNQDFHKKPAIYCVKLTALKIIGIIDAI